MFGVPVENDAVIANIKFPISGIELRMPSLSKLSPERSLTLGFPIGGCVMVSYS